MTDTAKSTLPCCEVRFGDSADEVMDIYFLLNEPLVRAEAGNAHTASDLTALSDYTVNAVNHIQDTPWQVNKMVLIAVLKLAQHGENIINSDGDVVIRLVRPGDPTMDPSCEAMKQLPDEQFKAMTKEDVAQLKSDRKRV